MKSLLIVLGTILTTCNKQPKSFIAKQDSSVAKPKLDTAKNETTAECIFNNDYKGLTTEWMKELGKTNFIWIDKLKSAAIPHGQDTIYLSKGGCTHFGISSVWTTRSDKHVLDDSAYWATNL